MPARALSRQRMPHPPAAPSPPLLTPATERRRSIVMLADEVESLMLETEIPPLDRFLLRTWIVEPALVDSAHPSRDGGDGTPRPQRSRSSETHRKPRSRGRAARQQRSPGERASSPAGKQPSHAFTHSPYEENLLGHHPNGRHPREQEAHHTGPSTPSVTTTVMDGGRVTPSTEGLKEDGVLSLGALQHSKHAGYYGAVSEELHGPLTELPTTTNTVLPAEPTPRSRRDAAEAAGDIPTRGSSDSDGAADEHNRGRSRVDAAATKRRHAGPSPLSAHEQRLSDLYRALLQYRRTMHSLLQAVKERERVWTALQWWCGRVRREMHFTPRGISAGDADAQREKTELHTLRQQPSITQRWSLDKDGFGHRRRDDEKAGSSAQDRVLRSAEGLPLSVRRQSSFEPHPSGSDQPPPLDVVVSSDRTRNGLVRPLGAARSRQARGHSAPPPVLPSAGANATRGGSHGRVTPTAAVLTAGSPYAAPPIVGKFPNARQGLQSVLPKSKARGSSAPPTRNGVRRTQDRPSPMMGPAASAEVPLSAGPRGPSPKAALPTSRRRLVDRPVSAPIGAVPRAVHAPCACYYLAHLQRTSTAVVDALRAWRKHLSDAFPLVVDGVNYPLEMLLQAVRLSEEPALRLALDKAAVSGAPSAAVPLLASPRKAQDASPLGKPTVLSLMSTPDRPSAGSAAAAATRTHGGSSGSPKGTARANHSDHLDDSGSQYAREVGEERRRARAKAQAGTTWPAAFVAYPLGSAWSRLASHAGADKPPEYLVGMIELAAATSPHAVRQPSDGATISSTSTTTTGRRGREGSFPCALGEAASDGAAEGEAEGSGEALKKLLILSVKDPKTTNADGAKASAHASGTPEVKRKVEAAERWLSKEILRQLACCRACMCAAVGLDPSLPFHGVASSTAAVASTGQVTERKAAGRPVLLLASTETLLQRELATQFQSLVARSSPAAQLWGQWLMDIDAWQRHVEDASSGLEG